MFCPNCKAEYRPAIIRCSDCDLPLVDRLPASGLDSDEELSDTHLREVWMGEDQDECVSICVQFKAAGIPYKVIQRKKQFLKAVDNNCEIGVPPNFAKRAKEIISRDRLDFTDKPEDQTIMELPAMDGVADATDTGEAQQLNKWDPQNATVEVWCQSTTPDRARMIESSLRENDIRVRTEIMKNGSRKIFVATIDEGRAREIVHEIDHGTPPK